MKVRTISADSPIIKEISTAQDETWKFLIKKAQEINSRCPDLEGFTILSSIIFEITSRIFCIDIGKETSLAILQQYFDDIRENIENIFEKKEISNTQDESSANIN